MSGQQLLQHSRREVAVRTLSHGKVAVLVKAAVSFLFSPLPYVVQFVRP